MRLVSYNIQYGTGRDGRVDLARIAKTVDGADVIALQEVERFARRTGMVDQPAALAALLPRYHWAYGPGSDLDASIVAADGRVTMRRRQFGNMLLSRAPLRCVRNHLLPNYGVIAQFSLQRALLECVIETPQGRAVRACSVHLSHLSDGDRAAQIAALLDIHRRAPAEGAGWSGRRDDPGWTEGLPPVPMPREAIIMGDFNLTAASPLYEKLVGPESPQYGRMTNLEGFVDCWVASGQREDAGTTCLSGSLNRGNRIDFCFASASLAPFVRRAWIDEAADGSDHQPIWTEIEI
jgi:endonuclease/exonuclease/phosphatase family metal-dependent hydrolase